MKNNTVYQHRLGLLIAYIWIILVLIGCQYNSKISQSTDVAGTSRRDNDENIVNLKMLAIGSKPIDFSDVLIEVNKILNKQIGVELEVEFLDEDNLPSEYHAIFAGGADFDLIQCFPYHYNQYVAKAAYMKLTDDMLKKCAPTTYKKLNTAIFDDIRINNHLYMIPSSGYVSKEQVLLIRGDLLQESGSVSIQSLNELESYFEYITENVNGMKPLDTGYNAYDLFDFLYAGTYGLERYDDALLMINQKSEEKPVFWLPETDLFLEFLETMKRWSEKGYIPYNASSKKKVSKEVFIEGKSASYLSNVYEIEMLNYFITKESPQYKPLIISLGSTLNQVRYPLDHGIAIKNGTTNAAKSLMVIEQINTNQTLFRLLNYGIQGTHYTLSPEGYYQPLAMSNRYPIYNNFIWCMNEELKLQDSISSTINNVGKLSPNHNHQAINMQLHGVKLDEINLLNKNLLYPMTFGNMDIIDNLEMYKKKMMEAGFDLYKEEVTKCINY